MVELSEKINDSHSAKEGQIQIPSSQDGSSIVLQNGVLDIDKAIAHLGAIKDNVEIEEGERPPTIFVGIAGGTASGKTTVCEEIFARVRVGDYKQSTLIPLDCFYKECTEEQMENIGKVNFDHPSMFDWDLVKETFRKLKRGEDVIIPDYNYITCKRNNPGLYRKWSPLIIFEGIFGLYDNEVNEQMDLKIFVHTDDDIRLARRL